MNYKPRECGTTCEKCKGNKLHSIDDFDFTWYGTYVFEYAGSVFMYNHSSFQQWVCLQDWQSNKRKVRYPDPRSSTKACVIRTCDRLIKMDLKRKYKSKKKIFNFKCSMPRIFRIFFWGTIAYIMLGTAPAIVNFISSKLQ